MSNGMPDVDHNSATTLESARVRLTHALVNSSNRLSVLMLVFLAAAIMAPLPVVQDVFQRVPIETVPSARPSDPLPGRALSGAEATAALAGTAHAAKNSSPDLKEAHSVAAATSLRESQARFQRVRAIAQKFAARIKAREATIASDAARPAVEPKAPLAGAIQAARSPVGTLKVSDVADVPGAAEGLVTVKKGVATVEAAWSAEDIAAARSECKTLLAAGNIIAAAAAPIKEGACGAPAPVSVQRAGMPAVQIEPAATMNCSVAAGLSEWLTDKVQPAAKQQFGKAVVRLISVSSYACRNRNGQAGAPLSEHAHANAIDIAGFVLADGTIVKVVDGWGMTEREKSKTIKTVSLDGAGPLQAANERSAKMSKLGAAPHGSRADEAKTAQQAEGSANARFLRAVHSEACGIFGTVLGPEANEAHRDHLHLDMKERHHHAYCQ